MVEAATQQSRLKLTPVIYHKTGARPNEIAHRVASPNACAMVWDMKLSLSGKASGKPITKHDLEQLEQIIMSQITDITTGIQTNLDKITADIAALTAAGIGGGTPASDVAAVQTIATNVSTATTALDALVATIPPVAPPAA
jgi:hypothetical protein